MQLKICTPELFLMILTWPYIPVDTVSRKLLAHNMHAFHMLLGVQLFLSWTGEKTNMILWPELFIKCLVIIFRFFYQILEVVRLWIELLVNLVWRSTSAWWMNILFDIIKESEYIAVNTCNWKMVKCNLWNTASCQFSSVRVYSSCSCKQLNSILCKYTVLGHHRPCAVICWLE